MNDLYEKRREQMFPRLTKAQIARLEPHGRRVPTTAGQVLIEPGAHEYQMAVVLSGSLEGQYITATATHNIDAETAQTSEFSNARKVVLAGSSNPA